MVKAPSEKGLGSEPEGSARGGISLADYLELRGVSLRNTYLHVIRDPNASEDWQWALDQDPWSPW